MPGGADAEDVGAVDTTAREEEEEEAYVGPQPHYCEKESQSAAALFGHKLTPIILIERNEK